MRLAAAFFVDLKRSYVEMRGTLRWVYAAIANPEPFGDVGATLGFRLLADAATDVGGQILYSVLLDMGPVPTLDHSLGLALAVVEKVALVGRHDGRELLNHDLGQRTVDGADALAACRGVGDREVSTVCFNRNRLYTPMRREDRHGLLALLERASFAEGQVAR